MAADGGQHRAGGAHDREHVHDPDGEAHTSPSPIAPEAGLSVPPAAVA